MARDGAQSGSEQVLDLYRRMLRIRRAEERLARLFADGEIPGFIHLSIGQEAVAVGVGADGVGRDRRCDRGESHLGTAHRRYIARAGVRGWTAERTRRSHR